MNVSLLRGDCRDIIKTLAAASIDAVVTDPPYSLVSIQKRFGKASSSDDTRTSERIRNRSDGHARTAAGFMGQTWDTGEVAHDPEFWREVYRVLKPGAHVVAFGGTRTWHRMAVAIEDAGFEIRDTLAWLYGTGFPKSHDVAKAIDKAARGVPHGGPDPLSPNHGRFKGGCSEINPTGRGFGAGPGRFMRSAEEQAAMLRQRYQAAGMTRAASVDQRQTEGSATDRRGDGTVIGLGHSGELTSVGHSLAAKQWQGWGTALKPAFEPIVLARKPLAGTVADNVLAHGTGGLNIDACRIEASGRPARIIDPKPEANGAVYSGRKNAGTGFDGGSKAIGQTDLGRWPANLLHDGSDEVVALFPISKGQQGDVKGTEPSHTGQHGIYNTYGRVSFNRRVGEASAERRYTDKGSTDFALPGLRRSDAGSAARFFYSAKAGKHDRFGTRHPTVKPIALMRWLCRLVTPPGGTILDPFAGSGTTGIAAVDEGFTAILIERDAQYAADINMRLAHFAELRKAATPLLAEQPNL